MTRINKLKSSPSVSLNLYLPYVNQIEQLTLRLLKSVIIEKYNPEIASILDGQPYRVLRNQIPLTTLKQSGIFFTNHHLSEQLIKSIIPDINNGATIADPTCGVGNLLIACAKHLPIENDIDSTLSLWSMKLKGFDVHPELIKATKTRLALLAINRGAKNISKIMTLEHYFPNVRVSDGLSQSFTEKCIVINPPYSMVQAPKECSWSSGKISLAALFIEKCVMDALPGTKIVALLPDVLRTGSRYLRWRQLIETVAEIESIEIIGQFDNLTDIDVFILRLKAGVSNNKCSSWWNYNNELVFPKKCVSDFFGVHIGPVVPHRDPQKGRWVPYVHARLIAPWSVVNIDNGYTKRRFNGTTFVPPFVVVRRTSRPGDKFRATGTIVTGTQPVAVENHLVILRPYSGELKDCKHLMSQLRTNDTNQWLNERIRCRHLTTSAIKELPWIDD